MIRASGKRLLEEMGYRVETAPDGPTALQRLEDAADADRFDLLLVDHTVPRMSGVERLREVRARGMGMPAVLLSGFFEDVGPDQVLELGIAAVGLKPMRRDELASLVREALDSDPDPDLDDASRG